MNVTTTNIMRLAIQDWLRTLDDNLYTYDQLHMMFEDYWADSYPRDLFIEHCTGQWNLTPCYFPNDPTVQFFALRNAPQTPHSSLKPPMGHDDLAMTVGVILASSSVNPSPYLLPNVQMICTNRECCREYTQSAHKRVRLDGLCPICSKVKELQESV